MAFALIGAGVGMVAAPAGAATPTSTPAVQRIGTAPRVPVGAQAEGATPGTDRMSFDVVVAQRDPAGLQQFATAVSTKGNPLYHHFLTQPEVAAEFGPLPSTTAAVAAAVKADGLTVTSTSADGTILNVTGTVAQVESGLDTTIDTYRLASGRTAVANTVAPTFPASVAGAIQGVVGLNSFTPPPSHPPVRTPGLAPTHATPAAKPNATGPTACTAASNAASSSGSYTAPQMAHAYSLDQLYAKGDLGANVTIAVFALGDEYLPSDVSAYQSCYGTSVTITNHPLDGVTETANAGEGEFILDLETIIGLAPQAKILAYDIPASGGFSSQLPNWLTEEKQIETDDLASIVNESYAICESVAEAADPTFISAQNTNFQQAAAEGQSWLAATGDTGSQGCDRQAGGQLAFGSTDNPEHMIGVDSATHTSYVVDSATSSISVVNDQTESIVTTATFGASTAPDAIAVDQAADKIFVEYNSGANVGVINGATCNATTHSSCPSSANAQNSISTQSAKSLTGKLTSAPASQPAGAHPDDLISVNRQDIAVNPSTNTIYLSRTDTSHATNFVEVINESTLAILGDVQFHQTTSTSSPTWDPANIAVDPSASGNLYVTDLGGGSIFGISAATCNAGNTTSCAAWADTLGGDEVASTLVSESTTHRVYATVEESVGSVPQEVVLTSAGAAVKDIDLGQFVSGLAGAVQIQSALSPSGNELLVTGTSADIHTEGIVVIPLSTLAISANVAESQDCGLDGSSCDLTSMGSDSSTGMTIVYTSDQNESPNLFLDFIPLDVPPSQLGLSAMDPAVQPFVTAVGGTTLSALGPAPTETPWNDDLDGDGAGGGGISSVFAMPSYQTGPGVISGKSSGTPCAAASGDCREVPDIAADADPNTGYTLFDDGSWGGGHGGTSAATPLVAATIALVESQTNPATRLGLLNPSLYTLAAKGGKFNDITTGSDDYLGTGGGDYPATASYDMATGVGTPIATNLLTAFVSAPAAPTNAKASAGNTTASVSWTAPSNGGSAITGYVVTPFIGATAQTATTFNSTATTETVSGLTNGSTYTFKIAAKNTIGTGPQSTASAAIVEGAPAPPGFQSAQPGNLTAKVGWFAPANNGSAITGYVITPFLNGTTAQTAQTFNTTATSDVVTGLVNADSYTFKVAAKNASGTGVQSNATSSIKVGTPTSPPFPSAQPGTTTAKVGWYASTANASAVTGYVVTPVVGTTAGTPQTFNSTATTETVTGLTTGTTYTFRISGINATGTGPFSTTAAIKEGTPTVPALPSAQPGTTTAKVGWFASTANASPITGYVVTPVVGTTVGTSQTFNTTATSDTVTGLVTGTTYTFRVAAINSIGTGPFSTTAAIEEGTPTSPTFPSAQPGTTTAKVSWGAATANASAITAYVVTPIAGTKVGTPQTFHSTATTETVTGLVSGTTYTFRVAAVNGTGTGPYSATAAIKEGTPTQPTGAKATAGTKQATITWTAPTANSAPITGYVITPYIGATAQPTHTFNSTATTQIITGLTTGTSYTFRVAAINSVGTGPQSAATAAIKPS